MKLLPVEFVRAKERRSPSSGPYCFSYIGLANQLSLSSSVLKIDQDDIKYLSF